MAAKKKRKARKPSSRRPTSVSSRPPPRNFQPSGLDSEARFAGPITFLRLPVRDDPDRVPEVDVLLCGVPFDGGVSFRAGARFGPRAVREASALARGFSTALGIDIHDELRIADGGDVSVYPRDVTKTLHAVAARAESLARSGVVGGFIGGDQTITLGVLRGLLKAKLKPVALLHIDAHPDVAESPWGRELHHKSVVRRAVEEGLVREGAVMQVGVRGPYGAQEEHAFSMARGFDVVGIDEVKWDLYSVVSQVRKLVSQGIVYVSVDVSAVDPAFAPGVSVPVPGGMNSWELQQIMRSLVGADIAGFDVVETCPPYDHADLTSVLALGVVEELLASIADTRRSARPAQSSRSRQAKGRVSP